MNNEPNLDEFEKTDGVIIQGLDAIDVIKFVLKKNKRFQAVLLDDLEQILSRDSEEFFLIRKLFLDSFNNYTRSVLRIIFGEVEI